MKYETINPLLRPIYFFSITIPVITGANNSNELNNGISYNFKLLSCERNGISIIIPLSIKFYIIVNNTRTIVILII